ncbi:TIGR02281 family clan AA aspartic protease [Comamonas piscis]|uniref:TIGR02281 family clan AA aspartic protease n=1 Tax=Comamonas piscis TaxID=1562974 RepID=A0A7G5EP27_9BURK|nr:TIGR02281 family clan AA aspartic protease [Comamonas piscis]
MRRLALTLAWCASAAWAAHAQEATEGPRSVALAGILGDKALLVIDGRAPKAVAVGSSYQQVQVISVKDGQAQVRIAGAAHSLRMGESPVSVADAALPVSTTGRIVLAADATGHFMTAGMINGKATRFLVDTGATTVSMSASEARKLGIDFSKGRPVRMGTANGVSQGWMLKLSSVRISDVELRNVDAVVTSSDMPFVLLGNSFLNAFEMKRAGPQMTLDRIK